MTSAVQALIEGKSSVMKGKKPIPWADDGIGKIYLLSMDGDSKTMRPPEKYWTASNVTEANVTIYDSCTDRMSTCSVYVHKSGRLYFKKQGTTYYLDSFKEWNRD
jgi:hypothetical protein